MNRRHYLICWLLFTAFFFGSCKDSKIAQEMDGTWTTSYVTSYEDGTKSFVDEQITFKEDASINAGGTFFEIRTGQEEEDEDEVNATYRWVSKIEGTWEVNVEDLVLNYNISSLNIEIGKEDVDFEIKNKALLLNDWGSLIVGGLYLRDNLYKEIKKGVYKQMFRYYQNVNNYTKENGSSFSDIQIQGNILSYETEDMGRIKYTRIGDNLGNDEVTKGTNEYRSNASHQLSGFIDKYEIVMVYNLWEGGKVSGYYYYTSQGPNKKINFSGQLQASKLTITCNNQDVFDGYLEDDNYSGMFSNARGNYLEFKLYMSK